MDIKEQLSLLLKVCKQELAIISNQEKLDQLSGKSDQAKKSAGLLSTQIESLKAKKVDALKARREADERLQSEKNNLRKWESRAEKIKGERDYTALMSEIASQKRTIIAVENELAESLKVIKSIETKLDSLAGERNEKQELADSAFRDVEEMISKEKDSLAKNNVLKKEILEKLPKPIQNRYQKIFINRAGLAVSTLTNEVCQACMRTVPPELYLRIKKAEIIEQCPNCNRLLVVDDEQEPKK